MSSKRGHEEQRTTGWWEETMTNRPYEIDMPSLTKLKAMEDKAMGFNPSTALATPKVVRQSHAADEGNTTVAETNSAQRTSRHQRILQDLDDQRRDTSSNVRETARMDVDFGTEDQASRSHEMISQCEGHWLFANAVLGEGQLGVKAKGKVETLPASEISASQAKGSARSETEVDDLDAHESQHTQPVDTLHEQEYLIPKEDLLIMLEVGFAERPYWTTSDLADALQQPEAHLNEVLPQIAIFGPWLGGYPQRWCWRLKPAEEKHEGRWKGKGRAEFWE
ncbi:uncharacterized protein RHO25_006172 [Cercospora beticola]|uniref:TFIIF beta subunit HTH domain-containing protein n=1 Tax=Cercospora beticola TaxID=122368 RepID=A0ABZ0NPZ0_CERBT|nr:hypothetical protein RHO25_006172 [Cercospora beticola]CAK1363663.1 unnamed protein product [Cercospora beticola]